MKKVLSFMLSFLVVISCVAPGFTVVSAADSETQLFSETTTDEVYFCGVEHTHRIECTFNPEGCTCGTSSYLHTKSCDLYVEAVSDENLYSSDPLTQEDIDSIKYDKQLVEDENGNFGLQLEAWTEGSLSNEPTEIALVVDQSGSMYQAVDGPDSYYTYSEFIARNNAEEKERAATNPGYFMVITKNVRYGTGDTYLNWNDVADCGKKYAVALVRWNKELNRWERSMQVGLNEDVQYTSLKIHPVFKTLDQMTWTALTSSNYNSSSAKYFKSLYGASVDAYHILLSKIQKNPNAKLAVVGFSSPRGYGETFIPHNNSSGTGYSNNYGGTGIFVNGEFKHVNNVTDVDYQNAWMSTDTQESINLINTTFGNIVANYNETCTEDGFLLAKELFDKSPNNVSSRVVVLFTDGYPTVISTDTLGTRSGVETGYNYAIAAAYNIKNTNNAKVYAYSHQAITADSDTERFMKYISSTYPYATSLATNGGLFQDRNYYGFVNNSDDLEAAFGEIAEEIFVKSQVLNKGTVVKDVVTKYFEVKGEYNQGEVKVFNVPYVMLSDGTLGFEPDTSKWQDISDYVSVTINEQTIDVTNYDFPENSINPQKEGGNKLVVQIPISRNPEFIGGNQVETNTTESGIYQPDGSAATAFPVPSTDVKILDVSAEISDANIYYGSNTAKQFTVEDLQNSAVITVNGVQLDLSKPDEDYGLDWQDDYADVNVVILDENGNELQGGIEDLRADTVYSVKVTVDPIYEGTENIVATSNSAKILVFYPELTFKDSYHFYGESVPSNSKLSSNNWLSKETKWKNVDGVYSDQVTMAVNDVPAINLQYTLDHEGDTLDKDNIPVDVTVNSVGYVENVQDVCYFNWKQCVPECGFSINSHYGNEELYEFYLHVTNAVRDDSVVIDYGLPVKISILLNDTVKQSGSITAVGTSLAEGTELNDVEYETSQLTDGVATGLTLDNGVVAIDGDKLVYTPSNLEMSKESTFYYEYKTVDGEYLYAKVTVIPATNIYYEESFFTFKDGDGYTWKTAGETFSDKFQAEDRPGAFDFDEADIGNVYGSDDAYNDSYTYSLGSAKYTSVDAKSVGKEPTAEFMFCGTGFDLFSITNSNTGAVLVSVYKTDGKLYKNYIVQTYYGYSYEDGVFKPNPNSKESLYQVPVISTRDLAYDTYSVVIKPLYSRVFDMNYSNTAGADNSYDIYVDSIRVYNPAGTDVDTDSVVGNAYLQDGEFAPEYLEVRKHILESQDFYDKDLESTEFGKGSVFIDSIDSVDSSGISDKFLDAGPNNEVYLAKGQAIAFHIVSDTPLTPSGIQLGMKLVKSKNSTPADVVVMNTNDKAYHRISVSGSHEMYRSLNAAIVWDEDILELNGIYQTKYPIVVANTTDTIVSLTDFKWSYSAPPELISTGLSLAVTSITPTQALHATKSAVKEVDYVKADDVTIHWSDTVFKKGEQATVVVTTPAKVEKITVGGVAVTDCILNEDGTKQWTYTFVTDRAGNPTYKVVLYDAEKVISDPIQTDSITVAERTIIDTILEFIAKIFKLLGGLI